MTNRQSPLKRILVLTLLATMAWSHLSAVPAGCQEAPTSSSPALAPGATLKNIKDVAHRLRNAALFLINDVEQRDMVVTGSPQLIMPIAWKDKKPIGWAQEMQELGPALPPRKQWLDVDMEHLGDLVQLLQQDVDSLVFAANQQDQAKAAQSQMSSIMQEVQAHYKNLQELTKGPKYDNIAIGKAALAVYDSMKRLEKPWQQALRISRSKS